jgi:hypothetical protein
MTNQTTGALASPVRATSALQSFGDISRLLVLNTDSYKTSHYLQYPPGTTRVFSYIESRGGVHDRTVFFGLQYILKEFFSKPVTAQDIALAGEVCEAHGVPFNREGWMHIVTAHQGRLPVRICAVPEGSVVPNLNVLVTIENTDPACFWLTSFLETVLMRVWYPVAAVEKELQALYSIATELASPTADVIALPMVTKHEATNASAVDVVAKPAKVAKVKRSGRKAATLTSNDNKLLNYLVGVLKGGDSVVITGSKMAAGSGLPLGSVGVSLKKIIASSAVNQVDRGIYQLGTALDSSVAEPVTKNTLAKKKRQALTKKV